MFCVLNPNGSSNSTAATHMVAETAQEGGGLIARLESASPLEPGTA